MDAYIVQTNPTKDAETATELDRWLCVSGDIDDFIYYGEEPKHSER